jgi:hypothetical protein
MIFINGVAFEKVFNIVWIVSCTAPLHRTYTIVSAERQYLCSTYFAADLLKVSTLVLNQTHIKNFDRIFTSNPINNISNVWSGIKYVHDQAIFTHNLRLIVLSIKPKCVSNTHGKTLLTVPISLAQHLLLYGKSYFWPKFFIQPPETQ